jgi:hypothetical protein
MSAEVRDTLATFGAALDCVREKLQAAAIENELATLRAELYRSFAATIEEEHQRVLARKLIIERRKEEADACEHRGAAREAARQGDDAARGGGR